MAKDLKKYLNAEIKREWPARKSRIQQTVFGYVRNAPTEKEKQTRVLSVLELGTMPMLLALFFIIGGAAVVQSSNQILPGSRMYAVKLALGDMHGKISPLAVYEEDDVSLGLIERRTNEIEKLLMVKATERRLTADQQEKTRQRIEQAEEEIGKTVLAILDREKQRSRGSASSISGQGINEQSGVVEEKMSETRTVFTENQVAQTASAKELGKIIVSNLLTNTNLETQPRSDKVRELIKNLSNQSETNNDQEDDEEDEDSKPLESLSPEKNSTTENILPNND